MQIIGDKVFVGGAFVPCAIETTGTHIDRVCDAADACVCDEAIDACGGYVVPGFIDLHFHGAMGADLCDESVESIATIAAYEAQCGVTAICPATMTFPEDKLARVMDAVAAYRPAAAESSLVGVNMEGPFISPGKVGAQNPAYVQPCDAAMMRRLQDRAGGLIKLVDIAPEEPGALDFIREMADEVRISIAHTCADYATCSQAFEAGALHVTHMCNAMPGLHHREPGPIGAARDFLAGVLGADAGANAGAAERFYAELICDGKHVDPAMVRFLFDAFDGHICCISDSMMAAGLADGDYTLGGQDVQVHDSLAWLNPTTIAGGVTNVAECVRRLVCEMGIDAVAAIESASINPARALGIDAEFGSIAEGKSADILVLNENFEVEHVILRGQQIR